MRGSAVFRTGIAPGGALAGPWVRNPLWTRARAVPSLDLRFADNKSLVDAKTGASLVTFTRASTGTYVASDGTLRSAVTNLQRYSEDFTQGLTPTNATLTANQGTAPNGTLTADQYLETNANGLHSQEIVDHTFIAGVVYTFSCYAKSIGGRNFGPGFPTSFGSARFGFFNLSGSGSVVSTDAGVTASIQAVGDGWYRCSITSTCATGGGARVGTFITSGTSISYAGDITKGLLLWGAQLEQSSTAGEYIPTTSTINSAPRFDHNPTTGESLGLLVEEARANLLLRSEEFDNASWNVAPAILTVTANTQTAPNGTLTADTITTVSSTSALFQTVACAASTVYTWSFYVKLGTMAATDFRFAVRDDSNGAFIGSDITPNVTPVTTEWRRVTYTFTTPVGCVLVRPYPYRATPATYGTTAFLWGAQLEAGAFPTSYIPTTSATATRAADVASIGSSAFTSFYNQTEGTVFAGWSYPVTPSSFPRIWQFTEGAAGDQNTFSVSTNFANHNRFGARAQNVVLFDAQQGPDATVNQSMRSAIALKAGQHAYSGNGTAPSTNAGAMPSGIDRCWIGSLNNSLYFTGHIRRLTYWPVRLSNATLQAITQ